MGTRVEEVKKPAVIGSSSEGMDSSSELSSINVDAVLGIVTTSAPLPTDTGTNPNTNTIAVNDTPTQEDTTKGPPKSVTPT
jgi:hypothetical protein